MPDHSRIIANKPDPSPLPNHQINWNFIRSPLSGFPSRKSRSAKYILKKFRPRALLNISDHPNRLSELGESGEMLILERGGAKVLLAPPLPEIRILTHSSGFRQPIPMIRHVPKSSRSELFENLLCWSGFSTQETAQRRKDEISDNDDSAVVRDPTWFVTVDWKN